MDGLFDSEHDAEREIRSLRRQIHHHDRLYYEQATNEISDTEYDRLMARLIQLETEWPQLLTPDSPSGKVGGKPVEGFTQVEHQVPMLSIDNVYTEGELAEFGHRVEKLAGTSKIDWIVEYKVDGVALSLVYERGILVRGVTRGDGRVGDDVTHNARTIRDVPLHLEGKHVPEFVEIRGEAYISNPDFADLVAKAAASGGQILKNPRNATAGAIKLLDPKLCKERRLRFFAHSVGARTGQSFKTQTEFFDELRHLGLRTVPGTVLRHSFAEAMAATQEMVAELHALNFEVDGIVLKVNDLALREQLGFTSKSPRWVVAFKWEKYEAETQLEEIQIQVGKTGVLTPVAHLKGVNIAGTTVARASLHNRDEIERLGVKLGDWVIVEKAGKVIPHIVRTEIHRRTGDERDYQFPTHCPVCTTEVQQDEGGVYIRCPNLNCPARFRETVRYFASRGAMDIEGLGIKRIEQLAEEGYIKALPDLYRLHTRRSELIERKGSGEKSIDELLAGIEASKTRPLWRLLTALNIRHVGTRTAQILAEKFHTLENLSAQSAATLEQTDEVGGVIAQSIEQFFASDATKELLKDLKDLGLNFGEPARASEKKSESLAGKTIVVTGTLPSLKREQIEELIREHGGHAASSVSKKTSFVVAGTDAGSKLAKAESLGVEVIDEAAFLAMIETA